jgi:hypothetical protein
LDNEWSRTFKKCQGRDVKVTSPVSGRALVVPGGGDRELSDRLRQEGRAVHVLVDGVELGPGEDIERAKGKTPYGEACREALVHMRRAERLWFI